MHAGLNLCRLLRHAARVHEFDPVRRASSRVSSLAAVSRLVLAIDEGERLAVGVAHDEARGGFFDGPGRREAARRFSVMLVFPFELRIYPAG